MIGFKVKSVSDNSIQSAAQLIAITVEHMDTLITDWFPGLDAITVQGYRLVTRIIPCTKCIMAVCGVDREENEEESESVARNVPLISSSGPDSGINLSTTDGSSTSASPWPSPVHVSRKPGANVEGMKHQTRRSYYNLGGRGKRAIPKVRGRVGRGWGSIQARDRRKVPNGMML